MIKVRAPGGVIYNQTMSWYVADDEEAAANAKFYGAAQKMAEALEFYANPENWKEVDTGIGMADPSAHDFGLKAFEALLEAGYTEEDES